MRGGTFEQQMEFALLKSAQEAQVKLDVHQAKKMVEQERTQGNGGYFAQDELKKAMRASLEEQQLEIQKNFIAEISKEKKEPSSGFLGPIKMNRNKCQEKEEEEAAPVAVPVPVLVQPSIEAFPVAPVAAPVPVLVQQSIESQKEASSADASCWHLVIRLKK